MSRNEKILNVVSAAADVVLIVLSYAISSLWYLGTITGMAAYHWSNWIRYALLIVMLYALVLVALYQLLRVYHELYSGRVRRASWRILGVNFVGILAFYAFLYMAHLVDVSRLTLGIFFVLSTALVIIKDYLIAVRLRSLRRSGKLLKYVLVVGSGDTAADYARAVRKDKTAQRRVMGYVTAGPVAEADAAADPAGATDAGEKGASPVAAELGERLGAVADLDAILEAQRVDELAVALDPGEYGSIVEVMNVSDKYGTPLKLVPVLNRFMPREPAVESVGDVTTLNVRTTPLDNIANAAVKRVADIIVSAAILVLISPILLVVAIGVKVTSPGPILFKQERVGLHKKPFKMLKFRSMRVNAESTTAWSTNEDPRKTRFGSFIRKFSIDELPQFINVLKGDMSIVGPRPEIPHYVHQFKDEIPLYMLRHQVRPGITGWAQVNGFRGDTSIEGRVEYDLYYIENWTFAFDVKIFFMTIFGGFANDEKLV